jgi:hypothetical protein
MSVIPWQDNRRYNRKIIAIRGDTQSGHAGGLLNPEAQIPVMAIDEEGKRVVDGYETAHLNPVQERLWEWSESDRGEIGKLAAGDEIIFIEMGDMTQGARFVDDLKDASLLRQTIISFYNFMPWMEMENLRRMRAVKGTGVHVWGEGSTEVLLVMMLQKAFPEKDLKISDHYLLNIDGYLIDVSHHGPGAGYRNWTRGNAFELYVKSILMDDLNMGRPTPNIVLRGHKHEFTYAHAIHQVGGHIWKLPGFIVPPYCFIGSHAQKAVNSPSSMGVGTLALELVDGKLLDFYPFTHYVDLRTEEVLS